MTGKISEDADVAVTDSLKFAAAFSGQNYGPLASSIAAYIADKTLTLIGKTINAANNSISNLATSMFAAGVIDTDGTLAANSDSKLATQKAVKTYAGRVSHSFSAHKNGTDQTGIASATFTKLTLTTEAYDTGGYYDAANSKLTPPAGLVSLAVRAVFSGGVVGGSKYYVMIYKNGTRFKDGILESPTGADVGPVVSISDQCNGTDYYEAYVFGEGAGNKTVGGGTTQSYFTGMIFPS